MKQIAINGYKRISLAQAKTLYHGHQTFYIDACKAIPDSKGTTMMITDEIKKAFSSFNSLYRDFENNYCIGNAGAYPAFYIREENNPQNTITIEINNERTMQLSQQDHDGTITISTYNTTSKSVDHEEQISAGDFVMLMNYYHYVKSNNIHCDFINPNGTTLESWNTLTRQEQYNYIHKMGLSISSNMSKAGFVTFGFGKIDNDGFWEYEIKP